MPVSPAGESRDWKTGKETGGSQASRVSRRRQRVPRESYYYAGAKWGDQLLEQNPGLLHHARLVSELQGIITAHHPPPITGCSRGVRLRARVWFQTGPSGENRGEGRGERRDFCRTVPRRHSYHRSEAEMRLGFCEGKSGRELQQQHQHHQG